MKKKYIIIIGCVVALLVIVGVSTVAIKYKENVEDGGGQVIKLANRKEINGVPELLAKQGQKTEENINGIKYNGITIGEGQNKTVAILPNIGTELKGLDNKFETAIDGKTYEIGPGFKATYSSSNGWMVTYKGEKNPYSKHVTTNLVPKWIKMTDKTGYLYVPASSSKNQGFLMGYNLDDDSPFDWEVHINGTDKTIPRLNSFNLNGLMLNTDYGFYANKNGILYLFSDTYTMLLQNSEYPAMTFVFNTGAKNNIEPIKNMGYYNDSMSKSIVVNNNIPMIIPISSTEGYIYQKPTENAPGWIWFFNTNWNNLQPLNANGIMIPKGNYAKPVYNGTNYTVTVPEYNGVKGTTAIANPDFNGNYVNPTSSSNGPEALEIMVKDENGNAVQGQSFNITNESGKFVARNVTTNNNGEITLYGLPENYYKITPVNSAENFSITEVVLDGEKAPVANLVWSNDTLTAPANLNSTTGTITVTVPNENNIGVNLYKDGQLIQTQEADSNNQAVFTNVENGLYTVATVENDEVNSAQFQVGINSSNEAATTSFYKEQNLTTGNIFAEAQDENGNPKSGVTFELIQNAESLGTDTTEASGTINFENEPFGTYTLKDLSTGQTQQVTISNSNYTSWSYFNS